MSTSSPASPRRCLPSSPERLYAAHTALVGLILARQFPSLPDSLREDAYAVGCWGLWQAALRFDPARGFTFGTFAGRYIRGPLHSRAATFAGRYIRGHILHFLKREQQQTRLPMISLPMISLETPCGENEDGELADVIPDPQAERPGAALEAQAGFEARLRGLPERQKEVLRAVYQQEKEINEVAAAWGVSHQCVSQVHRQALAVLKKRRPTGQEFPARWNIF